MSLLLLYHQPAGLFFNRTDSETCRPGIGIRRTDCQVVRMQTVSAGIAVMSTTRRSTGPVVSISSPYGVDVDQTSGLTQSLVDITDGREMDGTVPDTGEVDPTGRDTRIVVGRTDAATVLVDDIENGIIIGPESGRREIRLTSHRCQS